MPDASPVEEAILLIEHLMNPDMSEKQSSKILTALEQGLACPQISDYALLGRSTTCLTRRKLAVP
ncbi:hypothetical protein [Streptomyces hydrogenans]